MSPVPGTRMIRSSTPDRGDQVANPLARRRARRRGKCRALSLPTPPITISKHAFTNRPDNGAARGTSRSSTGISSPISRRSALHEHSSLERSPLRGSWVSDVRRPQVNQPAWAERLQSKNCDGKEKPSEFREKPISLVRQPPRLSPGETAGMRPAHQDRKISSISQAPSIGRLE